MYNTKPYFIAGRIVAKMIDTIGGLKVRPNRYLITNQGDVINIVTGSPMKLELSQSGRRDPVTGKRNHTYYRVNLCMADGKSKHFLVHRIVAEYFCVNDDPEHKTFVDHLNDKKTDNVYTNLEWVTPKENAIRSYARGTSYTSGTKCHLAVYSDEQVHAICKLLEQRKTPTEIMKELNLIDTTKYLWDHPERVKLNSYIKKLRTGTFRKDITSQYNLRGSTTIERYTPA